MKLQEMWENAKNFFGMAEEEDTERNDYADEEEQVHAHPSVTNRVNNPSPQNTQPTRQSFYHKKIIIVINHNNITRKHKMLYLCSSQEQINLLLNHVVLEKIKLQIRLLLSSLEPIQKR